jgi:hypothetical protein
VPDALRVERLSGRVEAGRFCVPVDVKRKRKA